MAPCKKQDAIFFYQKNQMSHLTLPYFYSLDNKIQALNNKVEKLIIEHEHVTCSCPPSGEKRYGNMLVKILRDIDNLMCNLMVFNKTIKSMEVDFKKGIEGLSPMQKAMDRDLKSVTPTRRITPIHIPSTPGKDNEGVRPWYTWNSLTQKYDEDSEGETTLSIPNIISSEIENGRRRSRAPTPACLAPPTPQLIRAQSPVMGQATSSTLSDAFPMGDYDEWGNPLWSFIDGQWIDNIGKD